MKTVCYSFALISLLLCCTCKKSGSTAQGDLPDAELDVKVLKQNLTFPWEITWGPDNAIWMTERGGRISRVNPINGEQSTLLTISEVQSQGEGGLLGMVLHPDFSATPQVFVAYNYDNNGTYTEKVVRYTYNGTALTSPVILIDHISAAGNHNGCRLAISPDGKLFISTGDAANSSRSQNLQSLSGKILRINTDGSIPADNPFPGSPVWSYGHRNPQGLVFAKDRLYSSEHGNATDDEINIISKGRNYGWPNVEGFCNTSSESAFCTANNIAEPIYAWTPTIAPSGLDFYNSNLIPQWKNSLLLAVLKDNILVQLKLNAAGDKIEASNIYLKGQYGRLRDVCISPEGKVYVITSNGSNDKLVVINKK